MPNGLYLSRSFPRRLRYQLDYGVSYRLLTLPKFSPVQCSPIQGRGAKSQASVHFNDLPQRNVPAVQGLPVPNDAQSIYPTVVQQARNNMRIHDDSVLLTRVGSFYEVLVLPLPG